MRLTEADFLADAFSHLLPVAVVTMLPLLCGSQRILFQVVGCASWESGECLAQQGQVTQRTCNKPANTISPTARAHSQAKLSID